MSEQYMRNNLLRVAAAQICQTIGFNATQSAPLELLQDALHTFLHEFCRDLRRQAEHYNRTEANITDACLTLRRLHINISEMLDYISNVEPVPFALEIKKFPAHKDSNMNFLKPGSKEVLTRPVHIYEHLPPILPPDPPSNPQTPPQQLLNENVQDKAASSPDTVGGEVTVGNLHSGNANNAHQTVTPKVETNLRVLACANSKRNVDRDFIPPFLKTSSTNSLFLDEEGRPTREISSVVMTTGGFISPAIEGKLPDAMIPDIIEKLQGLDAPPPASRPVSRASEEIPDTNPPSEVANKEKDSETTTLESKTIKNVSTKSFASDPNTPDNLTPSLNPNNIKDTTASLPNVPFSSPSKKIASLPPVTTNSLPNPKMMSKLLKKSKKKSPNAFSSQGKLNRLDFTGKTNGINLKSIDPNDKAQRKCFKMLQKLSKSAKTMGADMMDLVGSDWKYKGCAINPAILSALPPGPERLQIEKILKKQAKYKQKLLKQQAAMQLSSKPAVDLTKTQQSITPVCVLPNNIGISEAQASKLSGVKIIDTKLLLPSKKSVEQIKSLSPPLSTTTHQNIALPQINLESLPDNRAVDPMGLYLSLASEVKSETQQRASDSSDKSTAIDIKLSTEPDRSKLNIFKKISKPKGGSKSVSPNANKMLPTSIYANNENQVINLPSGTTITPAPASIGRQVYPSDNSNIITVDELNQKVGGNGMEIGPSSTQECTNIALSGAIFGTIDSNGKNNSLINKPKKRGRKPGSKNQVKTGLALPPINTSLKKPKKLKFDKNMYGLNFPTPPEFAADQPLNLTNPNQFENANSFSSNFPMSLAKPFALNQQAVFQTQVKERKERKKNKVKNLPSVPGQGHLTVPTTEEVNSINKKLLRMDTVLKPAAPVSSLTISSANSPKTMPETPKDILHSPTKSSGSRKLAQQLNAPSILPANMASSFIPSAGQGFPNLQANILSMLPLYPFPPRPGLIPTPGLFPPPGLGSFSNNVTNSAAPSMMIPRFLPFQKLKTPTAAKVHSQDTENNYQNFSEATAQAGDRNYCNVAPLVPESMKLISPDQKLERPTHTERDYPKTPKAQPSTIPLNEAASDTLLKKFNNVNTSDVGSIESKTMPITTGAISFSNFDALGRKNASPSQASPSLRVLASNNPPVTTENQNFMNNVFSHNPLLNKNNDIGMGQHIRPPLNSDDPIEVSDDSNEIPPKTIPFTAPNTFKSKISPSFMKSSNSDAVFTQNDNTTIPEADWANKEMKKRTKLNKIAKKKSIVEPPIAANVPLDLFAAEKGGIGKLAGGADLIPLNRTGLSYSSKTIPSTSLTATTSGSQAFPVNKMDFAPPNIFENLTITSTASSSDMQKKRNKKLKKLKDEKIKKKKDKKDKSKNKERIEKNLNKAEKILKETDLEKYKNKDLLKKLKKEKKKEKQRMSIDCLPASATSPIIKQGFVPNVINANNEKVSAVSSSAAASASSVSIVTAAASLMPKLTFKIGSSQSPPPTDDILQKTASQNPISAPLSEREKRESSPELARISPLVTRPPKQKLNTNDPVSSHTTVLGVSSTASSSNSESLSDNSKAISSSNTVTANQHPLIPPSPWLSGGTLAASSVLLPQQLLQTAKVREHTTLSPTAGHTAETVTTAARSTTDGQSPVPLIAESSRPSSYIDAEGNRVWICPACGKVDDGSAMIGCDGCDAWYHWLCVGIFVAPKDNEDWFCRVCITRKKGIPGTDKKRKRNKKK